MNRLFDKIRKKKLFHHIRTCHLTFFHSFQRAKKKSKDAQTGTSNVKLIGAEFIYFLKERKEEKKK